MKFRSRFKNLEITGSLLLMVSASAWAWDLGARAEAIEFTRERKSGPEFDVSNGCEGDQLQKIIATMEDEWADGEDSVSEGLFSDIGACSIYEYEASGVSSSSWGSRPIKRLATRASVTLTFSASHRLGLAICEDSKAKAKGDNPEFNRQIVDRIAEVGNQLRSLTTSICNQELGNIQSKKPTTIVFSGDLLQIALDDNQHPHDVSDPYANHTTVYRSRQGILFIDPVLLHKERGNPGAALTLTISQIFNPETITFPLASNPATTTETTNVNYKANR